VFVNVTFYEHIVTLNWCREFTIFCGVTRVGVTRGGNNDGVTLIFLEKLATFFSEESDDRFSCGLLTTSILPRRLSSILSKFSHKN